MVPNVECLFVNRENGLFLSVHVDDIDVKLDGKKQKFYRLGKFSWKTLFDHVHLGCTQRECQISKDIVDNYKSMFDSRISRGAKNCQKRKLRVNLIPRLHLHGPMTWKVHRRNVWKDITNLQIKTTQQSYKVVAPSMDDHQFKEEENELVGELSTVCSQIVLKCLYLARTKRPDIFLVCE